MNKMQVRFRQQGAVLVISLLILLIITVVGVTSMQAATMDERMSGNMQDQNVAFQMGEASLREFESGLLEDPPKVQKLTITNLGQFESKMPGLYHINMKPGLTEDSGNLTVKELNAGEKITPINAMRAASVAGTGSTGASVIVTYLGGRNGNDGFSPNPESGGSQETRFMDVLKITSASPGIKVNTAVAVQSEVGILPIPE